MQDRGYSLLFILLLSLLPGLSQAGLYKWVDSNGKVHYSDKAPKSKVKAKTLKIETPQLHDSSMAQSGPASRAIIRPYGKSPRKVLILNTEYGWKKPNTPEQNQRIGTYLVGKGCTSRGAIKTPDVYVNQKGFFPDESGLATRIRKVINSLDYDARTVDRFRLISLLKKTGGLSLHSEITDLDLQICAPDLSRYERRKKPTRISGYQFTRNRIKLKIHWQLRSDRDQKTIYEATTSGFYNGRHEQSSVASGINQALEQAVTALLSDRKFVSRILVDENPVNLALPGGSNATPIRRKPSSHVRSLFLSLNDESWIGRIKPSDRVGQFLFGERCAAQKPVKLAQILKFQRRLFTPAKQARQVIFSSANELGYSILPADSAQSIDSNGYRLYAELVALDIQSCAPALPAASKYKTLDKIRIGSLKRSHITVTIKWTLKSPDRRTLYLQTRSSGSAGDLLIDNQATDVMRQAVQQATQQLFANVAFVKKITIQSKSSVSSEGFPAKPRPFRHRRGIARKPDSKAATLLVVSNPNPWKPLPKGRSIGYYAYGERCTVFRSKRWPTPLNRFPRQFPSAGALANAIQREIKSLDYPFRSTDPFNELKLKRKLGGLSLHAKILDLRFDSCAPGLAADDIVNKKKLYANQFKRHRAYIKVAWTLLGSDESQPLFETHTEGSADFWQINKPASAVIANAMQDATLQLFADHRFVSHLSPTSAKTARPEADKPGFFSRLFSSSQSSNEEPSISFTQRYRLQAQLGQVLADISQLKFMSLEFYSLHGKWPGALSELNEKPSTFSSNPAIEAISLQTDGAIIVDLKPQFGNNKILQFGPQSSDANSAMAPRWLCVSNVQKAVLPPPCKPM